jgi:selenocysteine lyase/cysteine desulfurase
MQSTDIWDEFRGQMPVAERWAYFDHAAVAPLSAPARDALAVWAAEAAAEGDSVYPRWRHRVEAIRHNVAKLLNASAAEVALLHSTTAGINLVAEGFPWRHGDNVVTLANEFPSNLYPWMNQAWQGVETRRVAPAGARIDLAALAAACDERTRIVSVSWVGYASGWRLDLAAAAEIAHARGALLFVDAIQGLGIFPLDLATVPLDFLAADGHKWLLGPEGAAVFFIRRAHLDLLRPTGVGWHSVANAADFNRIELEFRSTAARFEGGSPNIAGLMGFGASLDLLTEIGAERLGTRILEITDLACERLQAAGATILSDRRDNARSGIVLFDVPGQDPQVVRDRCLSQGVVLSCRGGGLRISPHAYSTSDDIERLIAAVWAA